MDDISINIVKIQDMLNSLNNPYILEDGKQLIKEVNTQLDSLNQHLCEIKDKVSEDLREEINSVFIWQEVRNERLITLKIIFWILVSTFWIKVTFALIDFAEKGEEIFQLTNQEKLENFILDRVKELKDPNLKGFFLRLINKLTLRFLNLTRVILIYLN